jgi:L-amino acid N-acyltransferase YncA
MATILLQEMINIARIRGISTMVAYVRAENKPMLTVFERAGFKRTRSEEPDEVNLQLLLQSKPVVESMDQ